MKHQKKKNNNILLQLNSINKLNEKWESFFQFLFSYVKKYKWAESFMEYFKVIYRNKMACTIVFLLAGWFWSNLLLKILYYFVLVDSLIISLLVLQNKLINTNSRRLCKNVILIFMTNANLIGGLISLSIIMFMYMEYSKLINRIIFKFIKFLFKLVSNFLPFINALYPQIKYLNFDDPDNTIYTDSKSNNKNDSTHDSNSDYWDSTTSSESDVSHITNKSKKLNYLSTNTKTNKKKTK